MLLFICSTTVGQSDLPVGASTFFRELGGLNPKDQNREVFAMIAKGRIDKVEAGGGVFDWTTVDGRIFARTTWMVEIGQMQDGYGAYDFNRSLSSEIRKRLTSDGFRVAEPKFQSQFLRYQKGSTVGTVEFLSFYLGSGNLPLRYEFIFNESYIPLMKKKRSRK